MNQAGNMPSHVDRFASSVNSESILPVPDFFFFPFFGAPSVGDPGTAGSLAVKLFRLSVSVSFLSSPPRAMPTRSPTECDPLAPAPDPDASAIDGSDDPGEAGDAPDNADDLDLSDGTAGTDGAGLNNPDPLFIAVRPVVPESVDESVASCTRLPEFECPENVAGGDRALRNCFVLFRMLNPADRPRRFESDVGDPTVASGLILTSPACVVVTTLEARAEPDDPA